VIKDAFVLAYGKPQRLVTCLISATEDAVWGVMGSHVLPPCECIECLWIIGDTLERIRDKIVL